MTPRELVQMWKEKAEDLRKRGRTSEAQSIDDCAKEIESEISATHPWWYQPPHPIQWKQYPKDRPEENSHVICKRAFGEIATIKFEAKYPRPKFSWVTLDEVVKTLDHNSDEIHNRRAKVKARQQPAS